MLIDVFSTQLTLRCTCSTEHHWRTEAGPNWPELREEKVDVVNGVQLSDEGFHVLQEHLQRQTHTRTNKHIHFFTQFSFFTQELEM